MVAIDLLDEFIEISARSEGFNFKLAGERLDDSKSLASDGAGRTEDGNGFHGHVGDGSILEDGAWGGKWDRKKVRRSVMGLSGGR